MKKLNDLQAFVYVSIISADNDEFGLTEDQKQEIMARYKESEDKNWAYILECMPEEHKDKLIEFFNDTVDKKTGNNSPNGEEMA